MPGDMPGTYDPASPLQWEELQRLPEDERLRTGITEPNGGDEEEGLKSRTKTEGEGENGVAKGKQKKGEVTIPGGANLRLLTSAERAKLVAKVLETSDQDNELLLQKLRARLDIAGLKLPSVEVRFENVSVEARVHLGTRALPTLLNFTLNTISSIARSLRLMPDSRRPFPILNGISSVLKPGRLTLLLGPPGAGKSTLMKVLAGSLDSDLKFEGSITYNGHNFKEFLPQRTAMYVPQSDSHIGEMTVRETLDFSSRVQGPGYRAGLVRDLERREAEAKRVPDASLDAFLKAAALEGNPSNVYSDYILKILGLDICSETMLGNAMVRGVSGGQKKRVTTGELLVGPKQVYFMDEISTGLDSSTTYLITNCLRHFAHSMDATVLVALLQPAPETYDLFDDIMLLSEGHVVYHGPREDVVPFFEYMGFRCPERKGVADFLQEVTSLKDQQQYWVKDDAPYSFVSVEAFSSAFQESVHGKEITTILSTTFPKEKSAEGALEKEKYGLKQLEIFKAVFAREFLLMKRNAFLYIAMTINLLITALITCTVFLRTTLEVSVVDGNLYLGAMFFGLICMLFNGFAELSLLIMRLPVFYKQRDMRLFPSWALEIPMALLSVPFSLWAAVLWTSVTYWVIGFAPEASRFFTQMLIFFLVHQTSISLFRLIGAIGRTEVVSNTFGAFSLIVLFLLGGFVLSKDNIHNYLIWGFWISPLMYAQNGLAVNEFLAPRWQIPAAPSGPTVGMVVLDSRALFTQPYWVWLSVGALAGFILVFNLLTIISLQFLSPLGKPQPVVSAEMLEEKAAARTGDLAPVARSRQSRASRRSIGAKGTGRGSALDKYRSSNLSSVASMGRTKGGDVEASQEGSMSRGMVLPFEPLALSFHNVNYSVDMPAEMKAEGADGDRLQLLRNVSGAFRPKVLTALVGVSGAGKTTLMDVLAGRKTGGYIEGDIRVSGYPKVQDTFARVAGYCEQNDIHTPQVTVYESLLYSAWLRLPSDVEKDVREDFVEEVMELVELDNLRDALVGLPGVNGLSTEQRKRLTIAVELVANPSIIFMDEPTSGLDARAAAIVMRAVRNTVDTGRTVVCTIHQPSIDIFESFDELLLMKRGGQVIYMGPLGTNSQLMIDYFEAIPGVPRIREGHNPATWMLEISNPAEAEKIGVDFAEIFRNSQQFQRNEELIEQLKTPPEGRQDLHFSTVYSTSYFTQFYASLWKRSHMYWRAPDYNVVRYFFCTIMALLVGAVFFGLGRERETQQQVFNVMGALYTASLFMGWNNAASVQPIVAHERTVFYRERAAGLYAPLPYALAQGVIEIPYVLIQTIIYSVITYAMIQFEWTGAKFMWYFLFMLLTLFYFTCYGLMSISITPNEQLSMVVSAFFFSIWNLLCGFLIPQNSIPWWWRWFYYINPVAWTLYGLIVSQLGDVYTPMQIPNLPPDQWPPVAIFLQEYFGYYDSMVGYIVLILIGFIILFFSVFTYALKKLNFQNR